MANKEKIKEYDNAYRDSHSKGIIFKGNDKYQQAKRRRLERRKSINQASQQNNKLNGMSKELDEIKGLVNKLIKDRNK